MASCVQSAHESSDLYDQRVEFRFFSKSKDVAPGKGKGETIDPKCVYDFKELGQIRDWRKKLSNFWISEFEIDGLKWASVEHFYQANKYKNNCPVFYKMFSLSYKPQADDPKWIKELPEDLSTNPAAAKSLGGKTGRYQKIAYRPKNLLLDAGFFDNGTSEKMMEMGQTAKYEQNAELREVLLATKYAKLVHISRGIPPTTFHDTMRIRKNLQQHCI
ncbi:uncharacterized protein LOC120347376 [Styela clava]|uniref:uncharacterized protein LOC120347376 n=1 Tax=Styela clava TaxID=7725 RepID=UPI001939EBF8|nr:uncharacterized protein LOC120347376 [Styela clava]XP_039273238.1 uncharacterized protein LOC120347376 [Styela clava]